MSLVKIAAISLGWGLHAPAIYTWRSAASGKPINFMARQAKSNIATRKAQNLGLATLAHAEVAMRKGRVPDSTNIGSAFVDGKLFGNSLGTIFKALKKSKEGKVTGPIVKKKLQQYISDNGQFNIKAITKDIKTYNNAYQYAKKMSYKPLTTKGAIYGSAIGGTVSYDNDKGMKSVLPGAIKGGIIGGGIGASIKQSAKTIRNSSIGKSIEKAHKEITHRDNYWINRLKDANSTTYNLQGRGLAKVLTDEPGKRFSRIQRSEALTDIADTNIKSVFSKGFGKKIKNLFHWNNEAYHSPAFLNKKYRRQIRMSENRGDMF